VLLYFCKARAKVGKNKKVVFPAGPPLCPDRQFDRLAVAVLESSHGLRSGCHCRLARQWSAIPPEVSEESETNYENHHSMKTPAPSRFGVPKGRKIASA